MDAVYIVGPGKRPWLRYSLRSLQNYTELRRVFVVGVRPPCVGPNAVYIPTRQHPVKWMSAQVNLRAACADYRVSESFVLMNDDFFFIRPVADIPTLHRGALSDVMRQVQSRGSSKYLVGMRETARVAREHYGIDNPLSYHLHVPMVFNKYKLLDTLDDVMTIRRPTVQATDIRTMYGNKWGIGGEMTADVKIHKHQVAFNADLPFRSTAPDSWGTQQTAFLRDMFPEVWRFDSVAGD